MKILFPWEARMSIYKKEITKYQTLLDKLTCGFDTLTFNSVDEKNMLAELLKEKVDALRRADAYCDYWYWHSQKYTDWEDPRL